MSNELTPSEKRDLDRVIANELYAKPKRLNQQIEAHREFNNMVREKVFPPTGMPFPICDICNRQVRRFDFIPHADGSIVFRAHCHGDMDTVKLDKTLPTDGAYLEQGRAFVRKRLPVLNLPVSRSWYKRTAHLPIKVRR